MSTVVFKDGILAADSKAYGGKGHASPGTKAKIHRLPNGARVGIVSAVPGEPERFLAWLKGAGGPEAWVGDKPDLRALMIWPDGSVYLFEDSIWASGPIECTRYTLGSGAEYALGALAMGATAEEAVAVAIELDVWNSGGPIRTLGPAE